MPKKHTKLSKSVEQNHINIPVDIQPIIAKAGQDEHKIWSSNSILYNANMIGNK